jgi:hypothetical protein
VTEHPLPLQRFLTENEKAVRQPGRPFSRENSSNGGSKLPSELSGKNLMRGLKAVSRNFWRINAFVFNNLNYWSTFLGEMTRNVICALELA